MSASPSSYGSSPASQDMPHQTYPSRRPYVGRSTIIGAAGAGFKLSLALNAVGAETALRQEMASSDLEIQIIAKKISEFSLMLKQVGRIVEENRTIASPAAIDTVTDIKDQSERDFDEIKSMIEMVQRRDDEGHFRGIEVAQRVTWSFKKRKMQYLLGQLEYLKDSLAIMLQTLELGKAIAAAHEGRIRPPTTAEMQQERAEIQNMIIVQHWSLIELQKLYGLAEKEALIELESPRNESPPPSYDADPPGNHLTLTIASPPRPPKVPEEDQSKAIVNQHGERQLTLLRDSCERALHREETALDAPVTDIVDHLLDEWTQVGVLDYYKRRRPELRPNQARDQRYKSHVESDDSEPCDSDTDYERSRNVGGFYLEGPRSAVKKNVRFNPSVEDEEDEEMHRQRRTTKSHILGRVDESSSDSDSSLSPAPSRPYPRRGSTSSTGSHRPNSSSHLPPNDRRARPYPYPPTSYDHPPRPTSSRSMNAPIPLQSQPGPPQQYQQQQSRPMMPAPNQTWSGPAPPLPQGSGLRPPLPPGALPRMPSGNYGPQGNYPGPSPGHSPSVPAGTFFPDPRRAAPGGSGPPPAANRVQPPRGAPPPRDHRAHRNHHHHKTDHDKIERKEADASRAARNIKKGIFGGTAIAGIMELLQGLDGL